MSMAALILYGTAIVASKVVADAVFVPQGQGDEPTSKLR